MMSTARQPHDASQRQREQAQALGGVPPEFDCIDHLNSRAESARPRPSWPPPAAASVGQRLSATSTGSVQAHWLGSDPARAHRRELIVEKEVVMTFLLQLLSERGILDRRVWCR